MENYGSIITRGNKKNRYLRVHDLQLKKITHHTPVRLNLSCKRVSCWRSHSSFFFLVNHNRTRWTTLAQKSKKGTHMYISPPYSWAVERKPYFLFIERMKFVIFFFFNTILFFTNESHVSVMTMCIIVLRLSLRCIYIYTYKFLGDGVRGFMCLGLEDKGKKS